jgi:hypothetical protein
MKKYLVLYFLCICSLANAQTDSTDAEGDDLFDMSLEELLKLDLVDRNFYLYGYINSNVQKTFNYPTIGADGSTQTVSDPLEWTPVRNFSYLWQRKFIAKNQLAV